MAAAISVSKGVFVFKNGAKAASKLSRKKNKSNGTLFCDSLWYRTYKSLWKSLEIKIQDLNNEMFSSVLRSLVDFLKQSYKSAVSEIPTAALLTGINMPDHLAQFAALKNEIRQSVSPHVATLNGEDCQNVKYLVETLINQLVRNEPNFFDEEDSDLESPRIKKSQCNFSLLQTWYEELYVTGKSTSPKKVKKRGNVIVVIISDFENFAARVLQDFILIASSYINVLPFVFVFGVATSLTAVHRSLPCHVSSKINIQVFHSSPSILYLNNVLENVLFSSECPFRLGGKVFNLFTDIFLFYDLSVSGFIQNFKYAMLEHFSYGNATALCTNEPLKKVLAAFTHDDFENVRRLLSFRKLVESEAPENQIHLLTNDDYLGTVLRKEIKRIGAYKSDLQVFLRCLHLLVGDLPKAPLGKQVRELYAVAVSKNITQSLEYKECFQLLTFQSRDELCRKLGIIRDVLENNADDKLGQIVKQLDKYLHQLKNIDMEEESNLQVENEDIIDQVFDRKQLKQKLLQLSHQSKPLNKYEKVHRNVLDFMSKLFETYLVEPNSFCFHEIFFFNDMSIQNHIVGSHRAAIHTALNDPHFYLQCSCCSIANDLVILRSMPDISIAYKLHLECGKMINLYDWLQSFLSIVDPQDADDDSKRKVDSHLQARFTQAVAELEYLGFIKSSKRKTDHVARLTWGG